MEQTPNNNQQNQHPYNPQEQLPIWEGGNTSPPPQHHYQFSQQQQSYPLQYPQQGNLQPPLTQQGQYQPYQQYPRWQQQPPTYASQWEKSQPPEGMWQPAPLQSYPPQYQPYQGQSHSLQNNSGQAMYIPQMQQPMYAPAQPMMMPQQVVNVNIQQHQHSLFARALYFISIGWWAGLIWLNIGYFFVLTIIGLPIGLMMLNRLPVVLTLRPPSQSININITGSTTNINISGVQQVNFLLRALYFIFVGWWVGFAWSWVAYMMFVFIVTIPVGAMMLNTLPAIITLRKN